MPVYRIQRHGGHTPKLKIYSENGEPSCFGVSWHVFADLHVVEGKAQVRMEQFQ